MYVDVYVSRAYMYLEESFLNINDYLLLYNYSMHASIIISPI